MIHHAVTKPSEDDYADFTDVQKQGWDPPTPITPQQRSVWESNLAEVVVTNPCDCGHCPSIGMRPVLRVDDENRDDAGGLGDYVERIILDATVDGCMLLLFVDDDSPSYLELAPADDEIYTEFPPPEAIKY
ncbi:hypothetical protein [Brevibacterium sp. FME37]|uniref:hypothetical protein n=1 Tax=Brevibacterium sp. FME37 TaxID=2742607 RepID=UPI00186802F8|nr:hypothetical protein [Brevibacterium sp. FME37]